MAVTLLPQASTNIDSADFFYIENHNTDTYLNYGWSGREYRIAPGKKKLVPFDVVALYYGDPRSRVGSIQQFRDSTGAGTVPERHAEVQRLCIRYGVYEQGMDNIIGSMAVENDRLAGLNQQPLRMENLYVRITTAEGTEIMTPLFDHEGREGTYDFDLDDENSQDVATIIANMQHKIAVLEGKKEILDDKGDNDDEGVTFDNPTMPA